MNETILVVDDEPGLREIIQDDLTTEGYNVITAASGRAALEVFSKNKIDLILSDVRMPDGDGLYLVKEIRKLNPTIPYVVLITGFADLTSDQAQAIGVQALMPKPYDFDKLLETVRKLIQASKNVP